ncbi:hypothetical protein FB451DRAFT_1202557 [Mycena latifolia]|nr:hypothetical protein FB451DRAFT_1202557 [Mycena latifolia]
MAQEIYNRRAKSGDLVESIFGSLVGIDDAAEILNQFLEMSIISVEKKEPDKGSTNECKVDHKAACANAAVQANQAVAPAESSPADPYRWKWALRVEASETAAVLFLNVIAIAAHAAAIRSGQLQAHLPPSLRFISLPNPQRAVPLSNEAASQDCRPDIVALRCSAFVPAPPLNAPTGQFWLVENSPFSYIRQHLPSILTFTTAQKSAYGPAIAAFENWFNEQESCQYLDMSRFCWPELELTGEAKLSDIHNAILQELVYMRQQRRTQPWMRSIVGLIITTQTIGLLRADTLGIEQCTFARDGSRGVLDIIRICLGLGRSSCIQRGQHPAFELFDTSTLGPPHLKSKVGKASKTRPSKMAVDPDVDVFAPADPTVRYTHRTVRFIKLRGDRVHHSPDLTKPDVTYYVHQLVQDSGSLVGRCPRIFCVSREIEGQGDVRHFVGPYALKIYYADHASECYKHDLVGVARHAQVKNVLLPTWEWRYGDALTLRGFPPAIVQQYGGTQEAAVVPNVVSNREEIFAQSDMKRMLVQCSGYDEFEQAFIDFAEGIASLAEHDLAHRDLSIGNVLLSKDTPCSPAFLSEAAASVETLVGTRAVFTHRALEQRIGGLLHDLDMAGRLHRLPEANDSPDDLVADMMNTPEQTQHPTEQAFVPQRGLRTGTPPFMAIGLLRRGAPHRIEYDLHSLLFVMVHFFWSYPNFLPGISFPQHVPAKSRPWPPQVLRWANRPVEFTLFELGALKRSFFAVPPNLREIFVKTLKEDLWMREPVYMTLFWTLYTVLWKRLPDSKEYTDKDSVTAGEVIVALQHRYKSNRSDQK